jgi:phosphate-selective porin OprO/OprP
MGQFKVPFAWEFLQSHKYLDFADRSLAVENMRFKGRDMGVMLHGALFDDLAEYQLAAINGTGENTTDDNDGKDLAGRLAFRPFHELGSELLSKLQLGVSGTWGNQNTNYSSTAFKTPGGTTFVDFADGTIHKGDRKRLGTELVWLMGPASIKAEWMRMWLDNFQSAAAKDDFDFYSWYLSGSYLLTGEKKTLGKIAPIHPFNPAERTWGAWEVAARYGIFHADGDLFDLAMATGADEAEAVTVGLSWYLNQLMRVTLDYEHTEFDEDISVLGKTVDDEDLIRFQCQLEF